MLSYKIKEVIDNYQDFPKEGILFRDLLPLLQRPKLFEEVSKVMSELKVVSSSQAIVAIDARGFVFGTSISLITNKPLILARKPGKLPGDILSKSYKLEYGENRLCIQKKALEGYEKLCIIDDLLATGGTASCVEQILIKERKIVTGLCVVVELKDLNGCEKIQSKVESLVKY